jgi:hypothetical protein
MRTPHGLGDENARTRRRLRSQDAAGPALHDPHPARFHDRIRRDYFDAAQPVGRAGAITPSNGSVLIGTGRSPSPFRAGVVILMARHQSRVRQDNMSDLRKIAASRAVWLVVPGARPPSRQPADGSARPL